MRLKKCLLPWSKEWKIRVFVVVHEQESKREKSSIFAAQVKGWSWVVWIEDRVEPFWANQKREEEIVGSYAPKTKINT
jgi:hypothetical protein